MLTLKDKNAVIYGAGGSLGSTIAKALADAGARVFLSGHHVDSVQEVADQIRARGGRAEIHQVDALHEKDVSSHIDSVLQQAGTIDISFNAIALQDVQDIPLVEMAAADFVRPVMIAMNTQFITATAAARVMIKQGSGVILSLTATPGGIGYPLTGGFAPACAAIETFSQNLASEIGMHGVRVVNIRSAGSPDSEVFKQAIENNPDAAQTFLRDLENDTMLKQLPLMEDIAHVAVFLSSAMASKITGVTIDVTGGTTAALNYKTKRINNTRK